MLNMRSVISVSTVKKSKKTPLGQVLVQGLQAAITAKKLKKPINLKIWLIPKLRRLSYMWPPRNEAKAKARISRGIYQCNSCKDHFGPKEIVIDHINPVVPLTGFEDLGKYVESLFCSVEGLQALCTGCHDKKTETENKLRQEIKNN